MQVSHLVTHARMAAKKLSNFVRYSRCGPGFESSTSSVCVTCVFIAVCSLSIRPCSLATPGKATRCLRNR